MKIKAGHSSFFSVRYPGRDGVAIKSKLTQAADFRKVQILEAPDTFETGSLLKKKKKFDPLIPILSHDLNMLLLLPYSTAEAQNYHVNTLNYNKHWVFIYATDELYL